MIKPIPTHERCRDLPAAGQGHVVVTLLVGGSVSTPPPLGDLALVFCCFVLSFSGLCAFLFFLHLAVVEVGYERVDPVCSIRLAGAELSRVVTSHTHTHIHLVLLCGCWCATHSSGQRWRKAPMQPGCSCPQPLRLPWHSCLLLGGAQPLLQNLPDSLAALSATHMPRPRS
eukprot:357557-Chlamydomonas_euryale.AAC.4